MVRRRFCAVSNHESSALVLRERRCIFFHRGVGKAKGAHHFYFGI
jgi:hypothetical protein